MKLKLKYELFDTSRYAVRIVEQDETTRGDGEGERVLFAPQHGMRISCNVCPACTDEEILWLRGSRRSSDDNEFTVDLHRITLIARAVAGYNGRKNVVKIGDAGYIY